MFVEVTQQNLTFLESVIYRDAAERSCPDISTSDLDRSLSVISLVFTSGPETLSVLCCGSWDQCAESCATSSTGVFDENGSL